ncbi:patatin-like protein [Streptomyces sp. NPDC032472]|uniref:patatin-like protein n=1 Tax=Streptomyces sp. NPDC032472 TaxID=3155018 RepID=UPI0033CF0D34
MSDDPQGGLGTELRLALAMRGGVSLAVWMGGACCETAALRSAAPRPPAPTADAAPAGGAPAGGAPAGEAPTGERPADEAPTGEAATDEAPAGEAPEYGPEPTPERDVYQGLLAACGYERVDVDVLVGTSAGGLNGVLMACHLVYGMPFGDGVRNLWLRLGDLEGLLRRSTPFHVPASLMRGDEVFYKELRSCLGDLVNQAPPAWRPPASLRLILTATRLRPRRDWVRPRLGRPQLVGRSDAYFRFRHRGALTDFPDDVTGAARDAALTRLAYAARTTSSFPGAFEPGQVYVATGAQSLTDPLRVDMRGVSSETGYPDGNSDGCVELMDGGLLDNIPVAWAVRAIAGAPVTRKADRWLLFLQPVPPFPPPPAPPQAKRRVTRLVRTAVQSLAVKAGSESLRDDALALQAADAAAQQRQSATGALPLTLDALEGMVPSRLGMYARTVGGAEATRLIRLLEDPADVTGPDALPLPAGPGPLEPLDETGEGSVTLFRRLRAAPAALVLPDGGGALPEPGCSPLPLARTVRLLLDWVRAWEAGRDGAEQHAGGEAAGPVAEELRRRLHAFRFAVAVLIAARDRLLLAAYRDALALGILPEDAAGPYVAATRRLAALMPALPPPGADPRQWETWAVNLAQAATGGAPPPPPAPVAPEAAYAQLWLRLAELGEDVGTRLPAGIAGFEALHEAASQGTLPMADALARAEVLLGPLRPNPLAEAADIAFHTVSAANTSWATDTVLPGVDRNSPKALVRAKLSGNQLNNFAAFLSARWRMSDWTWGRLDGAASLVSVVATDERLQRAFGSIQDPTALAGAVAEATGLGEPFVEAWAAHVVAQGDSVAPFDRVRAVLTELRQREVLAEELPLIAELHARGPRGGNRPPPAPPVPAPLAPEAFDDAVRALRAIGAEEVSGLVRQRDPRRAALRAGLLAWPALQPSGRGGARLVQGALGVLKPLVYLPFLFAVLAPWPALAAAALMWTGIAFCTGQWSSLPGHVPVCLYAMAALAAGTGRLRPPWLRYAALASLAVPPLALWLLRGHTTPDLGPCWRSVVIGAAFALAAAAVLDAGTDRWLLFPAAALAAGGWAALVQFGRPALDSGWWGALMLYVVLFWVTFVLPWLYPRAVPRVTPSPARSPSPIARIG